MPPIYNALCKIKLRNFVVGVAIFLIVLFAGFLMLGSFESSQDSGVLPVSRPGLRAGSKNAVAIGEDGHRHDGARAQKKSGVDEYEVAIAIVTAANTERRFASLRRLCESLLLADYQGYTSVQLRFSLDSDVSGEVLDYVYHLEWPFGPKTIRRRVKKGGLVSAVSECWFPSTPNEHGIILEDDLEVSPFFFVYLLQVLDAHYKDPDPHLIGFSLYSPRTIEVISTRGKFEQFDSTKIVSGAMFKHVLPCSWGAMWLPGPWKEFLDYLTARIAEWEQTGSAKLPVVSVPLSNTMTWKMSWKRYMIELMYTKELFMLYPSYPNQLSFATNHIEIGEHIKTDRDRNRFKKGFTVPLLDDSTLEALRSEGIDPLKLPPSLGEVDALDLFARQIIPALCMKEEGCADMHKTTSWNRPKVSEFDAQTRYERICKESIRDKSFPFHDNEYSKRRDKITILLYYEPDIDSWETLGSQLEYYASLERVAGVVITWGDSQSAPPPSVRLSTDVFATFLAQGEDSYNNRLNPSSKILTHCVVLVDVGVKVHQDDIEILYQSWLMHEDRLLGFFPLRRGDGTSQYKYMLGTVMAMSGKFLYDYTCNEDMLQMHESIHPMTSCEDIAMNYLVASKIKTAVPLYVESTQLIVDFGSPKRKERRGDSAEARRECIDLLDPMKNLMKAESSFVSSKRIGGTIELSLKTLSKGTKRNVEFRSCEEKKKCKYTWDKEDGSIDVRWSE